MNLHGVIRDLFLKVVICILSDLNFTLRVYWGNFEHSPHYEGAPCSCQLAGPSTLFLLLTFIAHPVLSIVNLSFKFLWIFHLCAL